MANRNHKYHCIAVPSSEHSAKWRTVKAWAAFECSFANQPLGFDVVDIKCG